MFVLSMSVHREKNVDGAHQLSVVLLATLFEE